VVFLDTAGNPTTDTRNFNFTATLDGTGLLTLMNGETSISNPASQGSPDFSFGGDDSSFSGGFINVGGWLSNGGSKFTRQWKCFHKRFA